MSNSSRRTFLQMIGSGALAGTVPASIARALEIPAHHRTGTIDDVEHVVVLMQENRSFDHYFGTMRGVRGFADPRAARLRSGKPVWYQPAGATELLPFRPPVEYLGRTFLPDPPHGWNDSHAGWNEGRLDQWVPYKGVTSMTFHQRGDLPFHFALADAFTICDAYHCSLLGPTDPNRYHLWTGWVGNDGVAGGPVITNAELGYDWSTYPERLQRAGISWKVYQDTGVGLDANGSWGWTGDPYIGNYGDNSLLYFHQYQNAPAGSPLAQRAKTGTSINAQGRDPYRLVEQFRQDVASGQLPQVSWIIAPEAYSEHPNHPADFGAWFISQFLDALTANPEVWSRTVLFVNYDEEGGFFDHMVPPTPPQTGAHGASTVSTLNEIYAGDAKHPSGPYGLGMRVPMIVVSPWSKGGWVDSQLFDHTSVIRFLEARFAKGNPDLIERNITPWRRAVVGDLTSAFDFTAPKPNAAALPSTAAMLPSDLLRHPDYVVVPPADTRLPAQEGGVRPARALPYALHANGRVVTSDGSFEIAFANVGQATAVFQVRPGSGDELPRSYTVEPGKQLAGSWPVLAAGRVDYDYDVHGPNGFLRSFRGSIGGDRKALLEVQSAYEEAAQRIALTLANRASRAAMVRVLDQYSGRALVFTLESQQGTTRSWELHPQFGWYDFLVTVEGDSGFQVRLAGHIENGRPSVSDPLMGGLRRKA
jgi:phospholipase C